MPTQQTPPRSKGFPPVFTSFTISVFNPMAAIAITIKNLLSVFSGAKNAEETPKFVATVVITLAKTNHKMKKGNIFFKENFE